MIRSKKILLLLLLLPVVLWPQAVWAQNELQGSGCDRIIMGGVCTVGAGDTLEHSIVVMGGSVIIEEEGRIDGDVVLLGGNLQLAGAIDGDIVAAGGLVNLEKTAQVIGDLSLAGSNLERESGSRVEGDIRQDAAGPFRFMFSDGLRSPRLEVSLNPLWEMLSFLFRSLLWSVVAILVVLFLPRHTEKVGQGAVYQPLLVGGVGLLTVILAVFTLVFLTITLIGIPLAIAVALLLAAAWGFGLISLGAEVGKRLAHLINQEWAEPLAAGIGTFLLIVVTNGMGRLFWIGSWLLPFLIGVLGVGAVVLTRFGRQPYPPQAPVITQTPVVTPQLPGASREEDRLP